jgi:hypothetical protein
MGSRSYSAILGCVWLALGSALVDVHAAPIQIETAHYGRNCTTDATNNLKTHLSDVCNGREVCRYAVELKHVPGGVDPAFGCHKWLAVTYSCGNEPKPRSVEIKKEALGEEPVVLNCTDTSSKSDSVRAADSRETANLQHLRMWIGVGFAIICLLFFFYAYKNPPTLEGQYAILKVVAALLAGAAGGFIAGDIVTKIAGDLDQSVKLTVEAGGAIGLFVFAWVMFPSPSKKTQPPAAFHITFDSNTTFADAAARIAKAGRASVTLVGFTPDEEATPLKFLDLRTRDVHKALEMLAGLVPTGKVRSYVVRQDDSQFELTIKG